LSYCDFFKGHIETVVLNVTHPAKLQRIYTDFACKGEYLLGGCNSWKAFAGTTLTNDLFVYKASRVTLYIVTERSGILVSYTVDCGNGLSLQLLMQRLTTVVEGLLLFYAAAIFVMDFY
jgi:hypothetical protein